MKSFRESVHAMNEADSVLMRGIEKYAALGWTSDEIKDRFADLLSDTFATKPVGERRAKPKRK